MLFVMSETIFNTGFFLILLIEINVLIPILFSNLSLRGFYTNLPYIKQFV